MHSLAQTNLEGGEGMRRSGLLGALVATALLFCMLPGVIRGFFTGDTNRMSESLRPAESRTLTLWLVGTPLGDEKLITQLCTACEKSRPGLRIYLRRADAAELTHPEAVLPDAVLYGPGDILLPEKCLLPIQAPDSIPPESLSCCRSAGTLYGLPLWYAPSVLSLPQSWLQSDAAAPVGDSYFGLSTPPPRQEIDLTDPANLPWAKLLTPGQLTIQPGVTHQQLMHLCPIARRADLASLADASPGRECARVWSYPRHISQSKKEALVPVLLAPAVSDHVRLFSLCRESEDAAYLLRFLTGGEHFPRLEEAGWLSVCRKNPPGDALLAQAVEMSAPGLYFPNAYAHTRQELHALCADAFRRAADPVAALLQLR